MAVRRVRYNGKTYATASGCRFVIFGEASTGEVFIYKRTSNLDTAKKLREKVRDGLIVDYVGGRVYGLATEFRWIEAA